ncbi:MAG: cupin domain-containing protein [Thermodesulfovibrio sp.]
MAGNYYWNSGMFAFSIKTIFEEFEKHSVWSDIGSWDSVYEVLDKDEDKNVKFGKVVDIDTKNSLILGNERIIATVGVEDLMIIETPDVIVVAKKGEGQKIKDLVCILKENPETKKITEFHKTVYRPWGSYTELEKRERYRIKRSEHWVVVKGTAKVILEDSEGNRKEIFVHENENVFVPKTTKHRLVNPGKIPLEIIEVQVGEYVKKDDIVRFEDRYKRG